MARNSISTSTYALVDGSEVPCDRDGHVLTRNADGTTTRSRKAHKGKFKLRWREDVQEGGVRSRAQRSRTFTTVDAMRDQYDRVVGALERGQVVPEPAAKEIPIVAALDQAALAWFRAKAARRKKSSLAKYKATTSACSRQSGA